MTIFISLLKCISLPRHFEFAGDMAYYILKKRRMIHWYAGQHDDTTLISASIKPAA